MSSGGTLLLSREQMLFPLLREKFFEFGFTGFEVTGEDRDSLNCIINDRKPRLVLVESDFYSCATPYMMGRLLKLFPRLNIAAVSLFCKFPADLAMWFIINGVKSYITIFEGIDEFIKGLKSVRDGKVYISPEVMERMELRRELPQAAGNITPRHIEILRLLCNGFTGCEICRVLCISEQTLYAHKRTMYTALNVRNENELIRVALFYGWIKVDELCFFGGEYALNPLIEKKPEIIIRGIK